VREALTDVHSVGRRRERLEARAREIADRDDALHLLRRARVEDRWRRDGRLARSTVHRVEGFVARLNEPARRYCFAVILRFVK